MDITVIICTYKRSEDVRRVLHALEKQTRKPDEIIIVDASPDNQTEKIASTFACQYMKSVPGLTDQRNKGIAASKGNFICFLDDDTLPSEMYLQEVRDCFDRNPEVVGVGGKITNEREWGEKKKKGDYSIHQWHTPLGLRWKARHWLGLMPKEGPGRYPQEGHPMPTSFFPPDEQDYEVEFLMGASCNFRKEVFDSVSFSSYFKGYGLYEDLDFCLQLRHLGKCMLAGKAKVKHFHAPSGRPNQWKYGVMTVRNGWFVWNRRWPKRSVRSSVLWLFLELVLLGCRLLGMYKGKVVQTSSECAGRCFGLLSLLVVKPSEK